MWAGFSVFCPAACVLPYSTMSLGSKGRLLRSCRRRRLTFLSAIETPSITEKEVRVSPAKWMPPMVEEAFEDELLHRPQPCMTEQGVPCRPPSLREQRSVTRPSAFASTRTASDSTRVCRRWYCSCRFPPTTVFSSVAFAQIFISNKVHYWTWLFDGSETFDLGFSTASSEIP